MDVQQKVREAARALFARKGVRATTVKDIAQAAGVSEGALYRHWPSKEELATDLFVTAYAGMSSQLRSATGEGDAADRLRRLIHTAFAAFEADPEGMRFLLLTQHDALPLVPDGTETPVDYIVALVRDGIAEGTLVGSDAEALAHLVVGALVLSVQSRVYGRQPRPLTEIADMVADALLSGIGRRG